MTDSQERSTPSGGSNEPFKQMEKSQAKKPKKAKFKNPPKHCQRELTKLCQLIDEHEWHGMMTLKLPLYYELEDENKLVDQICQMLVYRFRADGMKVGFLLKREFNASRNKRLHYHVIFSCRSNCRIKEQTMERIKKSWFKIVGAKNKNQGRYHAWDYPHNGEYLKKWGKGDYNVISIPDRYKNRELSPHMFHHRGFGRTGGISKPKTEDVDPPVGGSQLQPSLLPSVPLSSAPYYSPAISQVVKCRPVEIFQKPCSSLGRECSEYSSKWKFTQKGVFFTDSLFTHSLSTIHTKLTLIGGAYLTQSTCLKKCRTCEYEGHHSPKARGLKTCRLCDEPWDKCLS